MSDFALVHSNEGTFTYTPKGHHISKLLSGGHGQAGMDLLDKLGIQYNIVKTYQNGVRIGNIPAHKDKLKRSGTGQSWFPKNWTAKDIRHAGEHLAGLKGNRHVADGKNDFWRMERCPSRCDSYPRKNCNNFSRYRPAECLKPKEIAMSIQDELQIILQKRSGIDSEDSYSLTNCWKEETELLAKDISATIDFLDHECTGDQFSWISEIFDDLVEKTQSKALIDCFYRNAKRFPKETAEYHLLAAIKSSEDFLLE